MLKTLNLGQTTSISNNKHFKTDKLIQLQIDFIIVIENEINKRLSIKSTSTLLSNGSSSQAAYEFDKEFDREIIELKSDLNIETLDDEQLSKLYKNNLIKYFILKKLNSELEYARVKLKLSTRTQINLDKIRNRIEWLENEIEKIVEPIYKIEKEKINIIRREKSLIQEREPSFEITKEKTELNFSENIEQEPPIKKDETTEEVFFRWEKSSNGSTDSLLEDSSDSENERIETVKPLENPSQPEETFEENFVELLEENVKYNDFKLEEYEHLRELNPSVNSQIERAPETPKSLVQIEKQEMSHCEEPKEINEEKPIHHWLSEHNRFDFPDYSRVMLSLNSSSYHRLPLAITESYIHIKDADLVDGRIPPFEKKRFLEYSEVELLKLASDLKSLSKDICSAATESLAKKDYETPWMAFQNEVNSITKKKNGVKNSKYKPLPLLSPSLLPLKSNKNRKRVSSAYTHHDDDMKEYYHRTHLINLHDLKNQTKLKLNRINLGKNSVMKRYEFDNESKKDDDDKRDKITWDDMKPDNAAEDHSGPKFERVNYLLNINLRSNCMNQRLEAIKHLGLLQVGDHATVYNLSQILENKTENELIRYETLKSLILLGYWSQSTYTHTINKLKLSSNEIKLEILDCIIRGKSSYFDESLQFLFNDLIKTLQGLIECSNNDISLKSCVCIGHLGCKQDDKSIKKLIFMFENDLNWNKKTICLESLVRIFDTKSPEIINFIFKSIQTAPNWVSRVSAVKLLSHIGPNILSMFDLYDKCYDLLRIRLSDDPIKEVRVTIGNTIRDLQMSNSLQEIIVKNLESSDEETRAKAVVSIDMLGLRKKKIIESLVDMLELDSSEYVRTTVLKALNNLAPKNPKVMQAFNNLEKNSKIYKIMMRMNENGF
ncbi:unnamed protein product [Brachionus calyciflorus]|uniref:Uncharacterized protein n=1 Tax=Brachionus calyciflorus TaxID=104777 RepID=A0A814BRC8_9BILA|nr:unnamed protein product [Brachionus calyciflorus]